MNKYLNKYNQGTIVEKLIYINVGAFLLTFLLNSFGYLFQSNSNLVMNWFSMPSNIDYFITRPWSIISYGFLHAGFFHILTNLLVLYYIGNLFIDYFTQKQLLSFYLFGTVFGGLLYLVSYTIFPALQNTNATLVGASAAVMAIFIGIATYIPNYEINIRFIGFVKLWKLAAFFVGLDLIQIPSGNAGGHLAHLGGALFGFIYMSQIRKGTLSFTIKNPFSSLFSKRSNLRTVYKAKRKKAKTKNSKQRKSNRPTNQQQIDAILDKISKSGYDSLNQEEKNLLFKQGKKNS
ncbi:rhomboid family intramembrane serine protease [Flavicella sp.]|uniref:rhomboid family intramembrane serine protease n=1 Tax=Flavicella sp. TaxID=2957742 RepID=UPI00262686D1|nr:rhomboid family intramembrane serine protease [Flavicella sp.]MDG1804636.1 rhomboid family intramembrane serine protease [Flavicella sp.]